jgi:hypothetical protein
VVGLDGERRCLSGQGQWQQEGGKKCGDYGWLVHDPAIVLRALSGWQSGKRLPAPGANSQ